MRVLRRLLATIGAALWASTPAGARDGAPALREGTVTAHAWEDVLAGRTIRVYLPPGYDDAEQRYPVLYLLDGQNLFDEATSFAGEWRVDETCDAGIAAGRIAPLIVVGIDNGGTERIHEYTPWSDRNRGGGGGSDHLRRIVRELKPRIDARYRTEPGIDHTGVGGSSLGGLLTLYAALEWSRVFGRFAALSPSLHWADARTQREFEARRPMAGRLYVDMGSLESRRTRDMDRNGVDDSIDDLRALGKVLRRRVLRPDEELRLIEDEGGIHHESAWARRLPTALEFLFPGPHGRS